MFVNLPTIEFRRLYGADDVTNHQQRLVVKRWKATVGYPTPERSHNYQPISDGRPRVTSNGSAIQAFAEFLDRFWRLGNMPSPTGEKVGASLRRAIGRIVDVLVEFDVERPFL